MAEIKNDNFDLRAPKPLDKRYAKGNLPYADEAEAHSLIAYRYQGLPFLVASGESFDLFWYKGGTTVDDIVPLIEVKPSDIADLQAQLDGKEGSLGFTPVPDTRQINSYALTSNITLVKGDVGLSNVPNVDATQASNITSGIIPAARYGSATVPVSAINATGGGVDDFLSKGGVWKQPTAQNIYFSTKFSGAGTEGSPIDISTTFLKVPSYTTTERNALTGMLDGDTIYNNTVKALQTWDTLTSAWV